MDFHSYQIDFSRSSLSLENVKAYGQLKEIIKNQNNIIKNDNDKIIFTTSIYQYLLNVNFRTWNFSFSLKKMVECDKIQKNDPDFKVIYGCEGYLVDNIVNVYQFL